MITFWLSIASFLVFAHHIEAMHCSQLWSSGLLTVYSAFCWGFGWYVFPNNSMNEEINGPFFLSCLLNCSAAVMLAMQAYCSATVVVEALSSARSFHRG